MSGRPLIYVVEDIHRPSPFDLLSHNDMIEIRRSMRNLYGHVAGSYLAAMAKQYGQVSEFDRSEDALREIKSLRRRLGKTRADREIVEIEVPSMILSNDFNARETAYCGTFRQYLNEMRWRTEDLRKIRQISGRNIPIVIHSLYAAIEEGGHAEATIKLFMDELDIPREDIIPKIVEDSMITSMKRIEQRVHHYLEGVKV